MWNSKSFFFTSKLADLVLLGPDGLSKKNLTFFFVNTYYNPNILRQISNIFPRFLEILSGLVTYIIIGYPALSRLINAISKDSFSPP